MTFISKKEIKKKKKKNQFNQFYLVLKNSPNELKKDPCAMCCCRFMSFYLVSANGLREMARASPAAERGIASTHRSSEVQKLV